MAISHPPGRLACLTIDIEPDLHDPARRIRLLDDDDRLTELTGIFKQHNVPLTCFIVMSEARRYRDRLDALSKLIDVEFAVHSYSHDTNNPASPSELQRSWDAFGELWNAAPHGYRAPNCLIDERGVAAVAKQGFQYDSSIVPSIRPDKFGYNNLRFGREPFYFEDRANGIVELPIATLRGIALPYVLSYVKLLGPTAYKAAMPSFPLPDRVVTYFHPYDLYVGDIAGNIPGWKRYAHLRNASRAASLLADMIVDLKKKDYRFVLMRDLADSVGTGARERPYRINVQ